VSRIFDVANPPSLMAIAPYRDRRGLMSKSAFVLLVRALSVNS